MNYTKNYVGSRLQGLYQTTESATDHLGGADRFMRKWFRTLMEGLIKSMGLLHAMLCKRAKKKYICTDTGLL